MHHTPTGNDGGLPGGFRWLQAELAWPGRNVSVRDLWQRKSLGWHTVSYSATIAPQDVAYLRLTAA